MRADKRAALKGAEAGALLGKLLQGMNKSDIVA